MSKTPDQDQGLKVWIGGHRVRIGAVDYEDCFDCIKTSGQAPNDCGNIRVHNDQAPNGNRKDGRIRRRS